MITIAPSNESLDKVQYIAEKMEGRPFHFHSHLLYDVRTALGPGEINYLEIGNAYGMTLSLVASHTYKTNCYGVDLGYPDGIDTIAYKNVINFKNTESTFKQYVGNSRAPEIIEDLHKIPGTFDFIFIDGDHSKQGVLADFTNYSSLLKPGGILVFDDYLDKWDCPNVKIAIDEIVEKNKNNYDIIGSMTYNILIENPSLFKHPINGVVFEYNNLFLMVKK